MDKFTQEKRSEIMSAIHSRDTLPEIVVRKWLFAHGYRFRVCDRKIVGKPDIVLPRLKTLIEIRGCFWHHHGWVWDGRKLVQTETCPQATAPKSNRAFWNAKFRANVRRDQEHEKLWSDLGWNVIVIWECALKTAKEREQTFAKVARWLAGFEKRCLRRNDVRSVILRGQDLAAASAERCRHCQKAQNVFPVYRLRPKYDTICGVFWRHVLLSSD